MSNISSEFERVENRRKLQISNIVNFSSEHISIYSNAACEIKKDPKVSVIITVHNYQKYIQGCVTSVLKNSLKEIEIIIVDDCSEDDSLLMALEEADRAEVALKVVVKKTNTGVAHSRNVGILLARSDYVFILDVDNEIYPECLEILYNEIKQTKSFGIYSVIDCVKNDEISHQISHQPYDFEKLKGGNYIDAMAMFEKRRLRKMGGYCDDLIHFGIGWEDFELWLRAGSLNYPVAFVNRPLALYRVKENSMLQTTNQYYLNNLIDYLEKKYDAHIPRP